MKKKVFCFAVILSLVFSCFAFSSSSIAAKKCTHKHYVKISTVSKNNRLHRDRCRCKSCSQYFFRNERPHNPKFKKDSVRASHGLITPVSGSSPAKHNIDEICTVCGCRYRCSSNVSCKPYQKYVKRVKTKRPGDKKARWYKVYRCSLCKSLEYVQSK